MELHIVNNKGTFEIHGNFTSKNAVKVKEYFNYLLDTYYEIIMCLKKVKKIDESAMDVIAFVHEKAKRRSKTLFVLGTENEHIKGIFERKKMNYIFKKDYNQ